MPRPTVDLNEFREEIHSQRNLSNYLNLAYAAGPRYLDEDLQASSTCLGINPCVSTSTGDPDLVEIVNDTYHSTFLSDEAIASAAISQGVATIARQVKRDCLAHGWRRQDITNNKLKASLLSQKRCKRVLFVPTVGSTCGPI